MGIYKNLNPEDVSLRSFEVHKEFTFSNNDSGSGVYGIRAISGSSYNFQHSTANSQSFGEYNSISASMGKKPYDATFYELPLYFTINNMFYRDTNVVDSSEVDLTHWEKINSPRKAIVSSSNSDFPNTASAINNTLSIPFYPSLSESNIARDFCFNMEAFYSIN